VINALRPGDRLGPFILVDAESAFGKTAFIIHNLDTEWARKNVDKIKPWGWSANLDKAETLKSYKDYVFAVAPSDALTGTHYTVPGIPESWEVIEALQSSWPREAVFHLGNVGKYWFRLGRKQGASVESDLKKLIDYAQRALKIVESKRG
jgi:hypothetical protein